MNLNTTCEDCCFYGVFPFLNIPSLQSLSLVSSKHYTLIHRLIRIYQSCLSDHISGTMRTQLQGLQSYGKKVFTQQSRKGNVSDVVRIIKNPLFMHLSIKGGIIQACLAGQIKVVRTLLTIPAPQADWRIAFKLACEKGHLEIVREILEHKFSVIVEDQKALSEVFLRVCKKSESGMLRIFAEWGLFPVIMDSEILGTGLQIVIERGLTEIADLFIEARILQSIERSQRAKYLDSSFLSVVNKDDDSLIELFVRREILSEVSPRARLLGIFQLNREKEDLLDVLVMYLIQIGSFRMKPKEAEAFLYSVLDSSERIVQRLLDAEIIHYLSFASSVFLFSEAIKRSSAPVVRLLVRRGLLKNILGTEALKSEIKRAAMRRDLMGFLIETRLIHQLNKEEWVELTTYYQEDREVLENLREFINS